MDGISLLFILLLFFAVVLSLAFFDWNMADINQSDVTEYIEGYTPKLNFYLLPVLVSAGVKVYVVPE